MMLTKFCLQLRGLAVALLLLPLAACAGSSTSTVPSQPQSSSITAAASSGTAQITAPATGKPAASPKPAITAAAVKPADPLLKTELSIAEGLRQNESTLLKGQAAAFQKAYPNVKVTTVHYNPEELGELVKAGATSDKLPDLILAPSDYVRDWTATNSLQPASQVFDQTFLNGYVPNSLGASQLNGIQWGVPYTYGNVPIMLYNRKLIPAPPANTDEMVAEAKKLMNKEGSRNSQEFGLALDINQPVWFAAWLGGFGGSLLDAANKPALDTPEMVKTLQFYHDLAYKDKVALPNYEFGMNQIDYAFRDGRLGIFIGGDWNIFSYGGVKASKPAAVVSASPSPGSGSIEVTPGTNDYGEKFDLGVAPLPKISATGKYPVPLINNKALFVGAQTKGDRLKAAQSFVEFLAGPEQQQDMIAKGLLPTTQVGLNSESVKNNPVLNGLAEQLAVAKPQPTSVNMEAIWSAILPNLQGVSSDVLKPEEAAKKMQEMALQNLKKIG